MSIIDNTVIVIPARMKSSRFLGKVMARKNGLPLLHWTYKAAKRTGLKVFVASGDLSITAYCNHVKIPCVPMYDNFPNGTSRCMETLVELGREESFLVNWQCDEPEILHTDVTELVKSVQTHYAIGTLHYRCAHKTLLDKNTTKVALSSDNRALWFSKAPIPSCAAHCGIYVFCPHHIRELRGLDTTEMSELESLEQLTWIEHGYPIRSNQIEGYIPVSIDTPGDFDRWDLKC